MFKTSNYLARGMQFNVFVEKHICLCEFIVGEVVIKPPYKACTFGHSLASIRIGDARKKTVHAAPPPYGPKSQHRIQVARGGLGLGFLSRSQLTSERLS